MKALKMVNLRLALFRHLVIAHFARLRSICAHTANFWSLLIWGWMWPMLFVRIAICHGGAYAFEGGKVVAQ